MQTAEGSMMETEIGGCRVKLTFAAELVEGVIERIKSILSNAYDERVQNELMKAVKQGAVMIKNLICVDFREMLRFESI